MSLDLKQLIENGLDGPPEPGYVARYTEAVAQRAIVDSALTATAASGESVTSFATVVAALTGTIEWFGILLVLLALLMIVIWINHMIENAVARIPWVGGTLARYVHLSLFWMEPVNSWITEKIDPIVAHLWNDLTNAIGYFADRHTALTPHHNHYPTTNDIKRLNEEINATDAKVDAVNQRLNNLDSYVHNQPNPTYVPNQSTLPEQLHILQGQIHVLYQNQSTMYADLQKVVADLTSLYQDVQTLSKGLIGTRAIEAGFTDFETRVDDAIKQLHDFESRIGPQVGQNTRSINELEPLSLLLQPGMRGLQNLRKLEDDPCQCPKFKGIGNDTGTELAIELMVAHGV